MVLSLFLMPRQSKRFLPRLDESLLTGESIPVHKFSETILGTNEVLGDRVNMLYTGTLIERGRAQGIVVATSLDTVLGSIAADVLFKLPPKAPLQVRMDKFTHRVAIFVGIAALIMFAVAVMRSTPYSELFLLAVTLAVSVIPEGLPVALTVALAIGMRRMARRNVIVRRLLAVEAPGSCTFIATDKTGTLTVNQLTARKIIFPNGEAWRISGEGVIPEGDIEKQNAAATTEESALLQLQPVSLQQWTQLLALALTVLLAMDIHKAIRRGSRKQDYQTVEQ